MNIIKYIFTSVLVVFIFFMGYVSESLVNAYELRENQWPPSGKEIVDVNGTKFMREIKNEENENYEISLEEQIVLEKKYPSGCNSTTSLSEEYSCTNLFDDQNTVWQSSNNVCKDEIITFTFSHPIYLEFIVFQNPVNTAVFQESIIVNTLGLTSDNSSNYFVSKQLEYDNLSQWIDINAEIIYDVTFKIVSNFPQNIDSQESRCAIQEVTFYGRSLNR